MLRAFSSGKYCRVHLRNAKLIPHAALTKTENPNVGEPFATRGYSMLPKGDGVTYVKRHEHLTGQDVANEALPGSVTQPLAEGLQSEILAEFEDPIASSGQDPKVSWREEDLVIHKPDQPSGGATRKAGRPPGSKNKVPAPPEGGGLDTSDDSEDNSERSPVARRTRSRGKTQLAAVVMVTQDLEGDPNYGLLLEF